MPEIKIKTNLRMRIEIAIRQILSTRRRLTTTACLILFSIKTQHVTKAKGEMTTVRSAVSRVRIDGGEWGGLTPQFPCSFHCDPSNPPTS